MDKRAQIIQAFSALRKGQSFTFFTAQVIAVDGHTCTVNVDGLGVSDVRLNATTEMGENMILLTPAIGSYVLVCSLSGDYNNLAVLSVDRVDKIEIIADDTSVVIDHSGIVLNGGKLGGLVKVSELTKKLNVLEGQLNQLKELFRAWTPVSMDGGAALKALIATWSMGTLTLSADKDLANESVKQ